MCMYVYTHIYLYLYTCSFSVHVRAREGEDSGRPFCEPIGCVGWRRHVRADYDNWESSRIESKMTIWWFSNEVSP